MKARDIDGKVTWTTVLTPEDAERVDAVAKTYGSRANLLRAVATEKAGTMRDHHEYARESLGASDIASLTLRFADGVHELDFGEDGHYMAYIVDAECIIPKHYKLACEGLTWLKVYDDDGKTFECMAPLIRVYRAGEFGCIIQIIEGD